MRFADDERGVEEPRPAGPAPAGDPPPPAVAKASSGAVPPAGSPAGEAPDDDAAEVEHDLAALLEDAEAKKDEYLELARRTQADFENYRKRMAAEVQRDTGRSDADRAVRH